MDRSALTGEDIAVLWSNHDETIPPEPLTGIQGESSPGSAEGRAQLAERFDVHPNQITQWRSQLLEGAADVFGSGNAPKQEGPSLKELHAKIGQQALEIDFLSGALGKLDGPSGKR